MKHNPDTAAPWRSAYRGEAIRLMECPQDNDTSEESMSKAKDEMRAEYRREDLGKGVRGKYFERVSKGTNLVLPGERVAKAFPTTEGVNEALMGRLDLTEHTARISARAKRTGMRKRAG